MFMSEEGGSGLSFILTIRVELWLEHPQRDGSHESENKATLISIETMVSGSNGSRLVTSLWYLPDCALSCIRKLISEIPLATSRGQEQIVVIKG